jgi:hypothetical protein
LRVLKSLSVFVLIGILLVPISYYRAAGQNGASREMADVLAATAVWDIEDEDGNIFGTVVLVATKSHDGVNVHITADREAGTLSGNLFTQDGSIFEIDRNLDSAVLAPVSIDVCGFGQHNENGECIEVVETLEIEAEWTSVGPKATSFSRMTTISTADREFFLSHNTFKDATVTGSLNDGSLGDALFATISKAKGLQHNFGAPPKTPTLSQGGNKGFVAANAVWQDTTVANQAADVVSLRVREQIRGETTIELQIGLSSEDGFSQFLQGEITIPAGGDEDVFNMNMRDATAELNPISITVCDIELANECTDSPSAATYTIEASWNGIEDSALASRFTLRDDFGDSKQRAETNAVSMRADATGSIEGGDLGDPSIAILFHFSTSRVQFK